MAPSAAERRLKASLAAHESWASTDNRTARTAPARAARDARFLEEANGDPVKAEHLRRAYFARLALKSAQARRKAKEATEAAARALEAAAEAAAELADEPEAAAMLAAGGGLS